MAQRAPRSDTQRDHFDWFSAYLSDRGLRTLWRRTTFAYTAASAALPIIMLWTPAGPNNRFTSMVCIAAAGCAVAGALLWLIRWPTRRQSVLFALMSTTAIAATCLSLSNPYSGLLGCTTFAVIGGFVAYFHSLDKVLINFVVAVACSIILASRLVAATGDIALAGASIITVAMLNIGVPFGVQSLVHTLRRDLRGTDRDPLTGLHNRRSFHHSVYELMMLSPGANSHLVITMIDLDNFKHLNDTHGHAAGDAALISVGLALEENCHPSAVIARVGGEEFVIAEIHTSLDATRSAERLRQAIAGLPARVTASVGTASALLDNDSVRVDLKLIDELIHAADATMYGAKRAGGNRVHHNRNIQRRPHRHE